MKTLLAVLVITLAGCATIDLTQTKLAVATHADLLGAAQVYTNAGLPDRAAVVTAIDAQLTACEQAISAAIPKAPTPIAGAGPLTLAAQASVAVGNFNGIPAAVKLHCEPIPLISFPKL
jgi:hypothetical protein